MQIVSENESWGFHGTLVTSQGLSRRDAANCFHEVATHLVSSGIARNAPMAVEMLDSRMGRHFADALTFEVPTGCDEPSLLIAAAKKLLTPPKPKSWATTFQKAIS